MEDGKKRLRKVIVCKYTSLFNFIMPVSQKQIFAVSLEKGIYRLKYIPVIGFEELNKLAINSNNIIWDYRKDSCISRTRV